MLRSAIRSLFWPTYSIWDRITENASSIWYNESLWSHIQFFLQWTFLLLRLQTLVSVLLGVATLQYAFLYWLIMPTRVVHQTVYFDYGAHTDLVRNSEYYSAYDTPVIQLPTASVSFVSPQIQWTVENKESATVQSRRSDSVLMPRTAYDILVRLTLPHSTRNHEIGTFMLSTNVSSSGRINDDDDNRSSDSTLLLASSTRPVLVTPDIALVAMVKQLFWTIPAVWFDWPSFGQEVSVLAMNGFVEHPTLRLEAATIQLSHPQVQIDKAGIEIVAQLHGLRYMMYHWFVPTACLVIGNLAFGQAMMLLVWYIGNKAASEADDDDDDVFSSDGFSPRKPLIKRAMVPNELSRQLSSDKNNEGYQYETEGLRIRLRATNSNLSNDPGTPK